MILMNVEKAFDRVWHEGLLYKLIKINCPPYLIKIIKSFLENRKFKIMVEGRFSTIKAIPFGVPQGAVNSPTLYNIYTHDVSHQHNTPLALYADDTAFYASSLSLQPIVSKLSNYTDTISNYFEKWKINVNTQKTQAIFFYKT